MNKLEKGTFILCSVFLALTMLLTMLYTEEFKSLSTLLINKLYLLEEWRSCVNTLTINAKKLIELDQEEIDRLTNTFYSPLYKKEYEALKGFMRITDEIDITNNVHFAVLLNTCGVGNSEILRLFSNEQIPSKGIVVSPSISAPIGKIKASSGKTAVVIPIWNADFSAQVSIINNQSSGYDDLALIERNQVINFNPAFPYEPGDAIILSEYEQGGYILNRYNWQKIGEISAVKYSELVEKYNILYDYGREDILKERYFFVIE